MRKNLAIFAAIILLSSCSPTLSHFTQDIYEDNRWTDDDLRQIQFYLSHDIVLNRNIKEGSSEIINGSIKIENGKRIEEIVIKRGTPGIFLFSPKHKRLAVSFEDGSNKRFLMFGPNPKMQDRYVLLASEWKKRNGKVQYDGRQYRVASRDAIAGLMVDMKRINQVKISSRRAEGRRLD